MGSIHGPDPLKERFGADHSMSVYRDYKGNMLSMAVGGFPAVSPGFSMRIPSSDFMGFKGLAYWSSRGKESEVNKGRLPWLQREGDSRNSSNSSKKTAFTSQTLNSIHHEP